MGYLGCGLSLMGFGSNGSFDMGGSFEYGGVWFSVVVVVRVCGIVLLVYVNDV